MNSFIEIKENIPVNWKFILIEVMKPLKDIITIFYLIEKRQVRFWIIYTNKPFVKES